MTLQELYDLVNRSLFADLAFLDQEGFPTVRRVFCTWHKGLGTHLISTNTSSRHVQALLHDSRASLYFADSERFEGLCLSGRAVVCLDEEHRRLLWHDGDEKYYPQGVDDPDYCVIQFTADGARYYRYDGVGDLSGGELARFDADKILTDQYDALESQGEKES